MGLENMIKKLFAENLDLSKGEAIKKLKKIKNQKTGKSMWRPATIRSHISTFLNKRERESHAVHVESPVETIESRSNLKIGGKVTERHKPKDPFAIEPDGNVEGKTDQMKAMEIAVADEQALKKGTLDDVSKKTLNQASVNVKPFRDEIISIISDFVSEVRKEFTGDRKEISDLKKEISNLRIQGIPTYEPVVKYDDLELRESTIDAIQKNTEDRELGEESDYIDILIANYYEPIVKNEDYYEPTVEYDNLNLRQFTIDAIQKNTEEKGLREESEYIDNLIENEEKYTLKVLKIPS